MPAIPRQLLRWRNMWQHRSEVDVSVDHAMIYRSFLSPFAERCISSEPICVSNICHIRCVSQVVPPVAAITEEKHRMRWREWAPEEEGIAKHGLKGSGDAKLDTQCHQVKVGSISWSLITAFTRAPHVRGLFLCLCPLEVCPECFTSV